MSQSPGIKNFPDPSTDIPSAFEDAETSAMVPFLTMTFATRAGPPVPSITVTLVIVMDVGG